MINRTIGPQGPVQLRPSVRLSFGSLHTVRRRPFVPQSAAVEPPATDAAAPAPDAAVPAPETPAPAEQPAAAAPAVAEAQLAADAEAAAKPAASDRKKLFSSTASTTTSVRLKEKGVPVVKISGNREVTKPASFVIRLLRDNAPGTPVILRAVGANAVTVAIKVLARANEMLQEDDSSSIISFQPQRTELQPDSLMSSGVVATDFYAVKSPAADFKRHLRNGVRPMHMREDKQSTSVTSYIISEARVTRPDQVGECLGHVVLMGSNRVAHVYAAAIKGLIQARRELEPAGRADLAITINKEISIKPVGDRTQQRQQHEDKEAGAAAAAASEAVSDAADTNSSSSNAAEPETVRVARYTLQVHVCPPRTASSGGKARRASSGDTSSSRSSRPDSSDKEKRSGKPVKKSAKSSPVDAAKPSSSKAGMVEVPEAEWLQLKEQLEVVPHLTEQLQVMTRQHEQLLSLLAAQQQQQPEAEQ